MYLIRFLCLIILTSFVSQSCKHAPTEAKTDSKEGTLLEKEKPKVSVMELKPGIFYQEILSNGKLYALCKADLKFRVSEEIEKIYATNGDVVQKNLPACL